MAEDRPPRPSGGPPDRRPEAGAPGSVGARLVDFARTARPPEAALAAMRLSLFDWAACAIAGTGEPVAGVLRAQVAAEGGAAQASVTGLAGMQVPARAAALANGAISHALDYDDTHFAHVGHPSVAVIPAALAVAERQGADGAACLTAALVGAEASVRVGAWLGEPHAAAGFHTTATAGTFGAALAAGRLAGLDAEQLGHALGVASTRASGLREQFGTMGKPLNAGLAAANGVEAADLAAAGFRAARSGLDGPQGFGAATHGSAERRAVLGLGAQWQMERVSSKLHACCHGLHAMLEALSGLRLGPGTVDRVTVRTHPRWRAICDNPAPATGLEAKFSYQLVAAMALAGRDTAALESFSDAACTAPDLVALRDKVDVVGDAGLPVTAAEVTVTATGGRVHALRHDIAMPLQPEARRARLEAKARALLGPDRAAALAAATLGPAPDLPALTALLRAAPA